MNKSLSTGSHLNVCSANFSRLKKILNGFRDDRYSFDLLYSEKKNKADFNVISRTPHTLIIEAKLISEESSLVELILRINIYIDAQLAEVNSYQQEKPVPFFIKTPFTQSQDEKFQQNKILTEWLENIFINGAIERKEIDFLNE
ncbi:MAG: DUF1249 domain-containing protein [Pseudomonadota bacterium]|nr:DUF1249 domain-containing protein [Pseudomonadota bacterium]|tara:strand:- start:311 stop:742 length:432 start_codon:yes stop_codon:yes gene_type:complete